MSSIDSSSIAPSPSLFLTDAEIDTLPKSELGRIVTSLLRDPDFAPRLDAAMRDFEIDDPLAKSVAVAAMDEPTLLTYAFWAAGQEDVLHARRLSVYGGSGVIGGVTALPGSEMMASVTFTEPRDDRERAAVVRAVEALYNAAKTELGRRE